MIKKYWKETKEDENKDWSYRTEKHHHENIIKTLKIDKK